MEIDVGRLVDALPGLVWVTSADGRTGIVNQGWCAFTGQTVEQALRDGWEAALHPDDAQLATGRWTDIIASGLPDAFEARLRRSDGDCRAFRLHARPVSDASGQANTWCGFAAPLDDKPQRVREQDLWEFADKLPTHFVFLAPGGAVQHVNRAIQEYYGRSLEELKGWTQSDALHPDDRERVVGTWAAAIAANGKEIYDTTHRTRRHDGVYRWMNAQMFPYWDQNGELVRWISLNTDVDELKRAQVLLEGEVRVLEKLARDCSLTEVLEAFCRVVEECADDSIAGVLTKEPGAMSYRVAAAPGVPAASAGILDIRQIAPAEDLGETAGGQEGAVIVCDPARDPRLASTTWAALMRAQGLSTCWLTPILSGARQPLGMLAVFRRACGGPSEPERAMLARFAAIAGIAITRAQADAALRAGEADRRRAYDLLAEAQKLSKTGSFTWDAHPQKQTWSDEAYRIFGFEVGRTLSVEDARNLVHPDDRHLHDAMVERGLANLDMDATYRIVTPQGVVKHLRTVAHRLHEVTDRAVYLGAVQDVTEAKLVEEALKASEREVRRVNRELLDAQGLSHVGSYTADLSTGEYAASEELRRIWEFGPEAPISFEEILGRVHPADRAAFEADYVRTFAGSDSDFSFRIVTPSGAVRHLHSVSRILEHVEGGPVVAGIQQDETERVLAAEAVKASEAEVRRVNSELLDAQRLSHVGSFKVDPQREEHFWSEELRRIWEFGANERITRPEIQRRMHPDDRPAYDTEYARVLSGSNSNFAFRIVTPSGKVKHLHSVARILEYVDGGPIVAGFQQDETERVQAADALRASEAELRRTNAELARVSRVTALGALTASIAHEVNQPLAGIVANAATCQRMLAAQPPNVEGAQATAQRLVRDGNRAADVIQRLRALFANKLPALEAVDLNEAAAEVLALSSTELQSAKVSVRSEFGSGLPPVRGDRVQLQQVILNLVLNAADAMRGVDGRARELTVTTVRETGDRVRLSVRDAGVGVDPDDVEKLFEAFHTTKESGMGIGLAVSRSIIESHDGRLWAEPNRGPGATFAFAIPAHPGDQPPAVQ